MLRRTDLNVFLTDILWSNVRIFDTFHMKTENQLKEMRVIKHFLTYLAIKTDGTSFFVENKSSTFNVSSHIILYIYSTDPGFHFDSAPLTV